MADFKKAFTKTMAFEGGYADDPDDRGGETYKGVARVFHPKWPGWARIDAAKKKAGFPKSLDRDRTLQNQVRGFFKATFWDPFQGDKITDQPIAEDLFDTSVNMGSGVAVKFLQRALNALNRNGALYADISMDGKFGKGTLAALNASLKAGNAGHIVKVMNIFQGYRYIEIMEKNPSQEKYARGWLNRVEIQK